MRRHVLTYKKTMTKTMIIKETHVTHWDIFWELTDNCQEPQITTRNQRNTYLPTYLPTYLSTHPPTHLPSYPTCLPTYLPPLKERSKRLVDEDKEIWPDQKFLHIYHPLRTHLKRYIKHWLWFWQLRTSIHDNLYIFTIMIFPLILYSNWSRRTFFTNFPVPENPITL